MLKSTFVFLLLLLLALPSMAKGPKWQMGFFWPHTPRRLMAVLTTDDHQNYQWFLCIRESVFLEDCLQSKEKYSIPLADINVHLNWAKNNYLSSTAESLKSLESRSKDLQLNVTNKEKEYQQGEADFEKTESVYVEKLKSSSLSAEERRYLEDAKSEAEAVWQKKSTELMKEIERHKKEIPSNQKLIQETRQALLVMEKEVDTFNQLMTSAELEKYVELTLPNLSGDGNTETRYPVLRYSTHFFMTMDAIFDDQLQKMRMSVPENASYRNEMDGFLAQPYVLPGGSLLLRVHYYPEDLTLLKSVRYPYEACSLNGTLRGPFQSKLLTSFGVTVRYRGGTPTLITNYYLVNGEPSGSNGYAYFSMDSHWINNARCSGKPLSEFDNTFRITAP